MRINNYTALWTFLLLVLFSGWIYTQLVPDFSAFPKSGTAPLNVVFTDKSTGTIRSWYWSFPGGIPSSRDSQGPHTIMYNDTGSYNVSLTISDGTPVTEKKFDYITVYMPRDYGDAPDDEEHHYATLRANNGAYHNVSDSIYLGYAVDADADGSPGEEANGDDLRGNDDDGADIPTIVAGDTVDVIFTLFGDGYLNAWVDLNADGDWDDENEWQIVNAYKSSEVEKHYTYDTLGEIIGYTESMTNLSDSPDKTHQGTHINSYARIRFSEQMMTAYAGPGGKGEVEDYMIEIYIPDSDSEVKNELALKPVEFALRQNYPNPFNPETMIRFSLKNNVHTKIKLYNIFGEEVRTLIHDQPLAQGDHEIIFDGRSDSGYDLCSGVYICQLEADNFISRIKLLLVR